MTNSQKIVEIGAKEIRDEILRNAELNSGNVYVRAMKSAIAALKAEGFYVVRLDEEMEMKLHKQIGIALKLNIGRKPAQAVIETLKRDAV